MLAILTTIVQILPALIQIVVAVEKAIPQSGAGPAKLEMAKDILQSTYNVVDSSMPAFTTLAPVLDGVFGSIVKAMNSIGAFNK